MREIPSTQGSGERRQRGSERSVRSKRYCSIAGYAGEEQPTEEITVAGVRQNVALGLDYLETWLRGTGCVPLFNLMEDAATAEIGRAQLWQWTHHGLCRDDGRKVDFAMCDAIIQEELAKPKNTVDASRYAACEKTAQLRREMIRAPQFVEFLTVLAYNRILKEEGLAA